MSYSEVITVQQLIEEELDAVETLKQDLEAKKQQLNWSDLEMQSIKHEIVKLENVAEYLQDRLDGRYLNEN
tara:strand:+ start:82 stop:294 length:213 start_codon:yes stop_codon:yes gene_type:complete